jgi:hypothetical protein
MSLRSFCTLVLDGYLALPDTPNRSSRYDRSLAESWFHRQIPLSQIQAAFALALLRRFLRNSTNPPLQPIRSLHYFVPVLEEIFQLDSRYLEYCRQKAQQLFPQISFFKSKFLLGADPLQDSALILPPASVQIYSFWLDRQHK